MLEQGDPNFLHLMGSRINFSERSKYSGDRKNRRRPRSALLQHHVTNDEVQRRRPFSAETQTASTTVKEDFKNIKGCVRKNKTKGHNFNENKPKDNRTSFLKNLTSIETMSEHGSTDTFVSLGTKIKTKALQNKKIESNNAVKSYLRFRQNRRDSNETVSNNVDKYESNLSKFDNEYYKNNSAVYSNEDYDQGNDIYSDKLEMSYESYFVPLNDTVNQNNLAGRVSFGNQSVSNYEHRLLPIRSQPLSLVEEESLSVSQTLFEEERKKSEEKPKSQEVNLEKPTSNSCNQEITEHIEDINIAPTSEYLPANTQKVNINNYTNNDLGTSTNCNDFTELLTSESNCKNDFRAKLDSDHRKENLISYPSYLENSERKMYSCKVIEDYKKEIETINNLHELSLKDIQTDRISPTPFHLDEIFCEYSRKIDNCDNYTNKTGKMDPIRKSKSAESDISNISTKELIQNYLKVKEAPYKKVLPPRFLHKKKFMKDRVTKKGEEAESSSKILPNSGEFGDVKTDSSRIECVRNDQDVDSWISLEQSSVASSEAKKSEKLTAKDQLLETEPVMVVSASTSGTLQNNDSNSECKDEIKESVSSKNQTLDLGSMLKEIESLGERSITMENISNLTTPKSKEDSNRDNFQEIFKFLDQVEQSANEALTIVNSAVPQSVPKFESLLRLPQAELAQRLVTAVLQLEERSCCISLLQESLVSHKEQMVAKLNSMEKQTAKNMVKVKSDAEEAIKRHQTFIDQLINDKKLLNHRIEQLVDERKSLEERWKRNAQTLEERFRLQLKNQHDRMAAAQQIAKQRWVKEKAEKIKDLTVKGLEGELREMADRQQKEVADLKIRHSEQIGQLQAKHAFDVEALKQKMDEEKEDALARERQLASMRMEKQMLELESTYQEQRSNLIKEMRAENDKAAAALALKEEEAYNKVEKWRKEQENAIEEMRRKCRQEMASEKENFDDILRRERQKLVDEFEEHKRHFEIEQQASLRRKVAEVTAQSKRERDREIEVAIESMESEAQAGRRELTEALRRNKEQYEAELRELAETEKATLRRYQEAQARIRETEDKCADLEVLLAQADAKIKTLTEKLQHAESQLADAERVATTRWQATVDDLKQEIEQQKTLHEQQMQQLYAKVKVAVARKDSALQAMTRENAKLQEKVIHLEQRLQQQRKDYLKHK